MLRTSMGQLLVNNALPPELRDYSRVLDKKGMNELLRTVAEQHPEKYPAISKKLADIGRNVASEFGGNSASLAHMSKAKAGRKYQAQVRAEVATILNDDSLNDKQRHERIILAAGRVQGPQADEILKESIAEGNPYADQVISGSRGNKMNLAALRGSDWLYADHRDDPLPLPIYHSYAEGLKPIEYWAGSYGARKGIMSTKFATQDAGFLSKQLNQVAHRLMIVGNDYDEEHPEKHQTLRGLPADTDDPDNEGSLLGHDIGGYRKNTHLTPKILSDLKRKGHDRILVRSPLVGGSPDGGVYARDVGVREHGTLPGRGEQVGLTAAQALSEPLSQAQLGAKHTGGVAGQDKAVGGFASINQLIQVPKVFKAGAAHSQEDGRIERVEDAPAGGKYIWVGSTRHYVGAGYKLNVKEGDEVEAGDRLSEGAANPQEVTRLRGIGEGRYQFTHTMRDAMKGAGLKANRRNIELLSRGLINHVRLTDEYGDHLPGDIVPYSTMEHLYEPREDATTDEPEKALGRYLEQPVLHYTIGTKVRPSVLKELQHFGVKQISTHHEPPPFEPEMIRGMYSLQHDPDWMTRMYGSGQKASLLEAVHRGRSSDEAGTSFVPGLARAVDFGKVGPIKQPEKGVKPQDTMPAEDDMKRNAPIQQLSLPKATAAPARSYGPLSSWLKMSCDEVEQRREAEALIKRAEGTNTGSSTTNASGVTTRPTGQASGNPSPGTSTSGTGSAPTSDASSSHWNVTPQMAGVAHDPQQFSNFIQGGHQYGGEFGSAMNFASGLSPDDASVLTGGSPYNRPLPAGYMPGTGRPGMSNGMGMGGYPGMGGFQNMNHGGFTGGAMNDWNRAQVDPRDSGMPMAQQQQGEEEMQDPNAPIHLPGWRGGVQKSMEVGENMVGRVMPATMGIQASVAGGSALANRAYLTAATRGDAAMMKAVSSGSASVLPGAAKTVAGSKAVNTLAQTNKVVGNTMGKANTAMMYYDIAKGTGETLGDTISDVRSGNFIGGGGILAEKSRGELASRADMFDMDNGMTKGQRALSALQILDPVGNAKALGAAPSELYKAHQAMREAQRNADQSYVDLAKTQERLRTGQISDFGAQQLANKANNNVSMGRLDSSLRDRLRKKMVNYDLIYGGLAEVTDDEIVNDLREQAITAKVMQGTDGEKKRLRKLYVEMMGKRDYLMVADNRKKKGGFKDEQFYQRQKARLKELEGMVGKQTWNEFEDKSFSGLDGDQKRQIAAASRKQIADDFKDVDK